MYMTKKDYRERFYRGWVKGKDLLTQEVVVEETDLYISAENDIKEIAERIVKRYRNEIGGYIKKRPEFRTRLQPLGPDSNAPDIVKDMIRASKAAGVGPMASVAGAMAEFIGKGLLPYSEQVIVENGGDIFLASGIERTVAIFAGDSPLSQKLSIKVRPGDMPLGICTSSGTIGHSLSFGKADACVIISKSTSLADAVATAACNKVNTREDIEPALEFAVSIKGIQGALIVVGKDFGASGNIELA